MALINTCMECANQWEENEALFCPHCGSADFYPETEYDYDMDTIEGCIEMSQQGYEVICDADKKKITYIKEM